jgi:hypothetical protein
MDGSYLGLQIFEYGPQACWDGWTDRIGPKVLGARD